MESQFYCGRLFNNGEGIPAHTEEAIVWYTKSSRQGYFEAQHNLAVMYDFGDEVAEDNAKAVEL